VLAVRDVPAFVDISGSGRSGISEDGGDGLVRSIPVVLLPPPFSFGSSKSRRKSPEAAVAAFIEPKLAFSIEDEGLSEW
jgi:hypothetical protein